MEEASLGAFLDERRTERDAVLDAIRALSAFGPVFTLVSEERALDPLLDP
ncbi:hypothetical protein [Streptomyces sp. NPDC048002]